MFGGVDEITGTTHAKTYVCSDVDVDGKQASFRRVGDLPEPAANLRGTTDYYSMAVTSFQSTKK